jgi:thioredoxin 1
MKRMLWSRMRGAAVPEFLLVVSLISGPRHALAAQQSNAASEKANFEPLIQWKAALASGDRSALARFYSTTPPAQTKIQASKTDTATSTDPSEEPNFWSGLALQGMTDVNAKVLEFEEPRPGIVSVVLRVEFMIGPKGQEKARVVDASQVWVKEGNEWKIGVTERSDAVPRPVERLPEPKTPNVDLYPPAEDAPAEIQAALTAAAGDHKRVILVFGGNWCYDCHVLDTALRSRQMAPIVKANYHVVHVNIGNYDANLDIAKKYQVPLDKGVPVIAVLDAKGSLLYSQQHGEFESSVKIGPQDVVAFLQKWKPAGK